MSNQAGKGDKPRPLSVPRDIYGKNWDIIFSKKEADDRRAERKDREG